MITTEASDQWRRRRHGHSEEPVGDEESGLALKLQCISFVPIKYLGTQDESAKGFSRCRRGAVSSVQLQENVECLVSLNEL